MKIMKKSKKKKTVTIVIKGLNSEDDIHMPIESSLAACKKLKGYNTEVIYADSLSTDKTVDIAKKYPIMVVRLKHLEDRGCGVGPQLGYQYSKGDYVYILDSDMKIDVDFLPVAIKELDDHKELAGVAGLVKEMRVNNMTFKRREKKNAVKKKIGFDDRLEMGGLYKREALEDVGYFSNRNFHAYEEAELGVRLSQKGWKLKRLDIPGIEHYGYATSHVSAVLKHRWTSGYSKGSGEFLKAAFGKPYFFKVLWELKIYAGVLFWWSMFVLSLLVSALLSPLVIYAWLIFTGIFLVLFLLKKKDIKDFMYSIMIWHYTAVGMFRGLLKKQKDPRSKIASEVVA